MRKDEAIYATKGWNSWKDLLESSASGPGAPEVSPSGSIVKVRGAGERTILFLPFRTPPPAQLFWLDPIRYSSLVLPGQAHP